jgi:hypothetical protein
LLDVEPQDEPDPDAKYRAGVGHQGGVSRPALTGQATLWMAVFADMAASLLVVFNSLRLLRPAR